VESLTTRRTLATDSAREAALRIRAIMDQELPQQLRDLLAQGNLLATPELWDGPGAAQFQGDTWPRSRQALVGALDSLDRLHGSAAQVLEHIFAAGDGPAAPAPALALALAPAIVLTEAGYLAWRAGPWPRVAARAAVATTAGWISQLGAAGEAAAITRLRQLGLAAFDVNELATVGRGANFPLLDIASQAGLASVKVKNVGAGDLPIGTLRSYARDFRALLDPARAQTAAQELLRAGNRDLLLARRAWPADLPRTATVDDVAAYIRRAARLEIPLDHVRQVRSFLEAQIHAHPLNFGLGDPPGEAQVQGLLRRVRSLGLDSAAIDRMVQPPYGLGRRVESAGAHLLRFFDSEPGRALARGLRAGGEVLGGLAAIGDVAVIAHPDPHALGGADVQRAAAAASLVGWGATMAPAAATLLGVNAVADWVPGVGEVVMGATAVYFAADFIYQNHEAIGHFLSGAGSAVASVATNVVSGAMHDIQSSLKWPPHLFGL
jgi:hypothetical protein